MRCFCVESEEKQSFLNALSAGLQKAELAGHEVATVSFDRVEKPATDADGNTSGLVTSYGALVTLKPKVGQAIVAPPGSVS